MKAISSLGNSPSTEHQHSSMNHHAEHALKPRADSSSISQISRSDLRPSFHELRTPAKHKEQDLSQLAPDRSPLDSASWLSTVSLRWIYSLLVKGAANPLQQEDIWDLPMTDKAGALQTQFGHYWRLESQATKPRLLRALWRTTWPTIRVSFVLQLLCGGLGIVQPLLIKAIVHFLQGKPNMFGILSGYALAATLSALAFASATCINVGVFLAIRAGCNARTIGINSIYKKILRLSSVARRSMSSGEVVTLASVDCERIMDAYRMGAWALISPLVMVAVSIVIGTQTDVIVGLAVFAAMVCITILAITTSRKVGSCRHQIAQVSSERVKTMNETLQGIRVIKLYGWERASADKIQAIRQQEIAILRQYHMLRLQNSVLMFVAPMMLNAVCFATYILRGYTLDVATAFVVLALTNSCKLPFTSFANASVYVSEAIASTNRISAYLLAEEVVQQDHADYTQPIHPTIEIQNADFQWTHDTATPTLSDINLSITPKSLTIIVGTVGSGKSSLMNAILGEMLQTRGTRTVSGLIAYASQQPWIQNQTLRENILFGEPYDRKHYRRVIAACQLLPDFAMLEDGDSTEIGERGINLSGGQKARISVARAMYRVRHCDFLLFDDPLSALDVHVANSVFADGLNGLAKEKTRLLVLNSHYHFLQHADRILVMDGGRIVGDGRLSSLIDEFPFLGKHDDSTSKRDSLADQDWAHNQRDSHHELSRLSSRMLRCSSVAPKSKKLVNAEDRLTGSVGLSTYINYFSSCGWNGYLLMAIIVLIFGFGQFAFFTCDWFASEWGKGALALSQQSGMVIYVGLAVVAALLMLLRCLFLMTVCMNCSENMHFRYLHKVLAASVTTFFDITPIGRILNRFSRDLDQLDNLLPYGTMWMLLYFFQIVSVFIVCGIATPYVLTLCLPLGWVFFKVSSLYQCSARELKRIDSITRTPMLNLATETLSGIESIRSYHMTDRFAHKSEQLLNRNASINFTFQSANRWYTTMVDWLVAFIISAVAITVVAVSDSIGVTAAGLALTYVNQLTAALQRTMTLVTQTETIMTCYERIASYESLDEEGSSCEPTDELTLSRNWPRSGLVVFDDVSMRYRDDLELVLKNVSFTITSGEKVGVCGRTGSGKSSLMSLLFRVVECTSGRVLIDGVDISTITVHQLRTKLTIIPQDPVLFSGPLRRNLDPFDEKTDADLWTVLKKVHLLDTVSAWGQGLEYDVAENGDNLSVGQRQLICIARALVRESKVIVMDEATANVDQESDKLIQLTVRESFGGGDKTVLSIAHRLETIMDSDKILVLDAGELKEFDSPAVLMRQESGLFQSLVEASKAVGKQLE